MVPHFHGDDAWIPAGVYPVLRYGAGMITQGKLHYMELYPKRLKKYTLVFEYKKEGLFLEALFAYTSFLVTVFPIISAILSIYSGNLYNQDTQ